MHDAIQLLWKGSDNRAGFDPRMNRKNIHTNQISVLRLLKNEVSHKILGLSCQKFKMADVGHFELMQISTHS